MFPVVKAPITGLPHIKAPTTVPNAVSFEPNGWISTPLLRRPSNPLSRRTKLLIAVGVAALPACYFMFQNSDGSIELAVAPQAAVNVRPVEFLPSREAQAPAATDTNVESRIEPDVQGAPLPLGVKSADSEIEARPPETKLPARGKQLFGVSGYDDTCFPSASAVRQNSPEGRPSWTMRAPGHDGTKCWYAAPRTTAEAEVPSASTKGPTVQSRASLRTAE
jgi:hypothetical protein